MVGADGRLPLPWLQPALQAVLGSARPHHALLVHGAEGVGQFELALTLAQAWLCEAAIDLRSRPCGNCPGCRLVLSHNHPDLLVLLPEALQEPLGWAREDETAGGTAKSERKPSKELKVDVVRQAVAFAQLTASRGRAKVVVFYPAERLNMVAANTLLKTLEEPPGDVRFILACGAPAALPPTVRSRCQALHLALPDPALAARWLTEQGVAEAEVLLAAAGGQPLQAKAWSDDGIDADAWRRLPADVAAGRAGGLAAWPVPRMIEALQKLCHDALLGTVGVAPRYFPGVPNATDASALHAWSRVLARAARHAEHPVTAGLLVESLVSQGRAAWLAKHRARGTSVDYSA